MMATATVSFAGPRYAPEDPTLPKPWKGLVDAKTGYLYFWNPETNVTQYEKPTPSSQTGSAPPQKLSSAPVSSSVQVEQSSHGHCNSIFNDDDDRYNGGSNSGSKLDIGTWSYQGDNVPPPLTSFEATGFPSELLRETHEHHHQPLFLRFRNMNASPVADFFYGEVIRFRFLWLKNPKPEQHSGNEESANLCQVMQRILTIGNALNQGTA